MNSTEMASTHTHKTHPQTIESIVIQLAPGRLEEVAHDLKTQIFVCVWCTFMCVSEWAREYVTLCDSLCFSVCLSLVRSLARSLALCLSFCLSVSLSVSATEVSTQIPGHTYMRMCISFHRESYVCANICLTDMSISVSALM